MKKAMENLRAKVSTKAKDVASSLSRTKDSKVQAEEAKVVETPISKAKAPVNKVVETSSPKGKVSPSTATSKVSTTPVANVAETPAAPLTVWERGREAALQLAYMLFMYLLPHIMNTVAQLFAQIVERRAELPSLISQIFTKQFEEARVVSDEAEDRLFREEAFPRLETEELGGTTLDDEPELVEDGIEEETLVVEEIEDQEDEALLDAEQEEENIVETNEKEDETETVNLEENNDGESKEEVDQGQAEEKDDLEEKEEEEEEEKTEEDDENNEKEEEEDDKEEEDETQSESEEETESDSSDDSD